MEFFDSLDFQTNKKTNRVRSWYLYEQFKSLENNQLEAARKLKNRYYQDRILRRELSERKTRRSLYDQSERSRTVSRVQSCSINSETKTTLDVSNSDFFEGCHQLEEDHVCLDDNCTIHDDQSDNEFPEQEEISQDDSLLGKLNSDYKSLDELDDEIASVVENLKDSENITDEIREELEVVKHGIAENISLQLEAAKENFQCLEKLSDFCMDDNISIKSVNSILEEKGNKGMIGPKEATIYDNNLVTVWMKLVSFAYHIIQLNHGGFCYCDYSYQFLTVVLAFDVIRRGLSRMCDILQPFVCPIAFACDDTQPSRSCYKNVKRKTDMKKSLDAYGFEPCSIRNMDQHRKNLVFNTRFTSTTENFSNCECKQYNSENNKNPKSMKFTSENITNCHCKKYNSEKTTNHKCKCSKKPENQGYEKRIASEPMPNVSRKFVSQEHSHKTHSTLWPSELASKKPGKTKFCNCVCHARNRNPMLKIARYIDDILELDHW